MRWSPTDRAAARASYERSRVIRERLAAADPDNLTAQRDVSLIHDRLGNIHAADERYEDALASYRAQSCDPREGRRRRPRQSRRAARYGDEPRSDRHRRWSR